MTEVSGGSPPVPPAPDPAATPPPNMTRWGRRAALIYIALAGLALVAMLVETVLGHPGTGTMFAAILAAPWSMLAAAFLPPMPRDWPLAAGLAVRMAPLALFMLLNSAIIAGIAARSEQDVRGAATRVSLLAVLLALPVFSGCILSSRQVVLVAAPTAQAEYFNGGVRTLVCTFDLTKSPDWREHLADLSAVTDLTFVGTFTNPLSAPVSGPTLGVTLAVTAEPPPVPSIGTPVWGPLQIAYPETERVNWERGARLFGKNKRLLLDEIEGDGRFGIIVISEFSDPALGGVNVQDFHVGAVLQVR